MANIYNQFVMENGEVDIADFIPMLDGMHCCGGIIGGYHAAGSKGI